MSSGGGGGQNTTTSQVQIPAYEQAFSQNNQNIAQSLGSQPYPTYGGTLIQPQNATQQAGQQEAIASGSNWEPQFAQAQQAAGNAGNSGNFQTSLGAAQQATQWGQNNTQYNNALGLAQGATQGGQNANNVFAAQGAQAGAAQNAQALTNPNAVGAYMNPYIQQALAPQIQDLNLQLAQQQQGINSSAAQSGAFGDARQGAMSSLQNLYGNQAMNQLIGTGYNNAYTQAQAALGQAQNTQLGAASQYGNAAQTGLGEQNAQLQAGQNFANQASLANTQQGLQLQAGQNFAQQAGLSTNEQQAQTANAALQAQLANQLQQQQLTGANATYNVGQQQQTQQQQELNAAYQQYLNQVNWPYQMLNVQESALSNSPYNVQTAVTLPSANNAAQGFGTLASAAGLLGSLGGAGAGAAPFGGTAFPG